MTDAVQKMLAAIPRTDRDALIKAHEAAAGFHAAMANAIQLEADIEEEKFVCASEDDVAFIKGLEERYTALLGNAAAAMRKVPVKWLAILGIAP